PPRWAHPTGCGSTGSRGATAGTVSKPSSSSRSGCRFRGAMKTSEAVRRSVLAADEVAALQGWVSETEAWPAGSHRWGHYAEQTANGPAICRTENVSACQPGIAALADRVMREVAADGLGGPVRAFQAKVNDE